VVRRSRLDELKALMGRVELDVDIPYSRGRRTEATMIVVDTSVLVAAFRARIGWRPAVLRQLLDADEVALAVPARTELLSGASRARSSRSPACLVGAALLYRRTTLGTPSTVG
jgi:hypothetical protein